MTTYLQGFIKNRIAEKTTMRAFGSGWSWTGVNTTAGGVLLDTSSNINKGMNLVMELSEESVLDEHKSHYRDLVLCQCGIGVKKLNQYLERTKRSLKTSGASDGQTNV